MKLLRKAALAFMVIAANLMVIGCGSSFRPIATPIPPPGGNPAGPETDAVLNQCPVGMTCTDFEGRTSPSNITAIEVSGDSNVGNKQLLNRVAACGFEEQLLGLCVAPEPGNHIMNRPMAWDGARTSLFTANSLIDQSGADIGTDTVSQLLLNTASTSTGFADTTKTITLPQGALPMSVSFEYFGLTYSQIYVVDRGSNSPGWLGTCATGGGGLSAITQSTASVKGTVCLGAGSVPIESWIYKDQSKVFVADVALNQVYVVNAADLQVTNQTNPLPTGIAPFKFSQSNDGLFIYVLNHDDSISIINGQAETVSTVSLSNPGTSAPPVDIVVNANFNDPSASTLPNRVWVLHADGVVSVWNGTTPGTLTWITSIATITPAQAAAGAYPTNIALLRDGTWAYVGIGNTDQMVAIDTSKLANGAVTQAATTSIAVGTHRSVSETLTNSIAGVSGTVLVETSTPTVTAVGVSRQGTTSDGSAQLSKAYAATRTDTTYFCYDANAQPTSCTSSNPWANGTTISVLPALTPFLVTPECSDLGQVTGGLFAMSCPNLFNGTTIVAAAGQQATPNSPAVPVNTVILTLPAPLVTVPVSPAVSPCESAGSPAADYTLQKNCPLMIPEMVQGRS